MSAGGELSSFLAARPVLAASVLTACAAAVGLWLFFRRQRSSRSVATVTGLFIYPVKSCQGISVTTAQCEARGFRYDRRWVIVDTLSKNAPPGTVGMFLTQKQQPKLAQIKTAVEVDEGDGSVILRLNAPGMNELAVRSPTSSSEPVRVHIYRFEGEGLDCGDEAATWLATFVESMPGLRLYYMPDNIKPRKLADDSKWGSLDTVTSDSEVGFANFSPYLLANEKSLEELTSRLPDHAAGVPVTIRRFRANIVVNSSNGQKAFSEDKWAKFTIGDVPFRLLKKCGRCPMTTLDPDTGRKLGNEPLNTLKEFRLDTTDERHGPSPCFGVNLQSLAEGTVSIGDEVVLC